MFVVNTRSYRSRDAKFPTTYHSRQVQHPGNSDPLQSHIFCRQGPQSSVFCKGLDHNAIPKPTEAGDLRPYDMGSIHPFIFATLRGFGSPQISFFIVFGKDVCRPRSSPRPHQSRRRFWVVVTVLSLVLNAIDSVHNRFASPIDIQGQFLPFLWYSKFDGRKLPWSLCQPGLIFVCFGEDSHRRDARHSHPCEDRRDAETAH